jgi:glycerol-3-phosphate dehydrogenase (NAD(P)+)
MKNAYALGVSLAVGLAEKRDGEIGAVHYNSQAALFGQSVKEMTKHAGSDRWKTRKYHSWCR